ncbi:hypothetical protein [Microcoleus sp. LEGE 07076]|uniref:hypothetical protein n=1 Tax=Microcoleus sp. LEGE 07076 TaxID=915322 RepID=UPI00187F4113|nr:hypothetical protein [Microcoleus sp. LEGE 07076]
MRLKKPGLATEVLGHKELSYLVSGRLTHLAIVSIVRTKVRSKLPIKLRSTMGSIVRTKVRSKLPIKLRTADGVGYGSRSHVISLYQIGLLVKSWYYLGVF